ncbi:hypothetical protein AGMMS50267_01890 [Spirochaetia bacterium]|nr:hypothetical protein AGMMS50267_01890 [Spirochaetia bacterium]
MNNRLKTGRTRIALMPTAVMTMAMTMAACTFGLPEAVTVKTNPVLSFPLGSIGSALNDQNKGFLTQLDHILDPKELEKTLPGEGGKPFPGQIYRYSDIKGNPDGYHTKPGGVQTYMITYPIQKMNQDLSQYMKTDIPSIDIEISDEIAAATTLASVMGGFPIPIPSVPPSVDPDAPTLVIPFPDVMVTWMANIKLAKGTGIVFKNVLSSLQNALELCIPQFGIGSIIGEPIAYTTGRTKAELAAAGFTADELDKMDIGDNDLAFVCDTAPVQQLLDASTPGTIVEGTEKIQVYARLVGQIAAQTLKPTVAFEWEEVDMYPGAEGTGFGGLFEGFDLSSVLDQMKDFGDVAPGEIPGYLFLSTEDHDHIITALDISVSYNVGGVISGGKIEGGVLFPFADIIATPDLVNPNPDHTKVIDDNDGTYAASGLKNAVPVKGFDLSFMLHPENKGAILEYDIRFTPGSSVRMTNGMTEISIKADMGMILPMEFTFGDKDKDGKDISMTIDGTKYIPLTIKQLDSFFATSEDGGEDGSKDAIAEALGPNSSFVGSLQLTNIVNGLTGGMYLGVSEDSNDPEEFPWQVLPLVSKTEMAGKDPDPLIMTKMAIPAIRILLKEDAATPGKAPFYIKEQTPKPVLDEAGKAVLDDDGNPVLKIKPELDFNIIVGGVLDLDKTIAF